MSNSLRKVGNPAAVLAASLLVALLIPQALAQSTATLTGLVADQSKALIPGADVVLIDEASGDPRRTISNEEGYFTFTALMAKTYKLRVEMAGFQTWERIGIVVHTGDKIHINDIVMSPGAPSDVVTVSGAANEIIPVDSGEKSTTISAGQIQNTPIVGRDATELLKILPGMVGISTDVQNRAGFTGENIGINGNGAGGKQSAIGNFSGNGSRPDAIDITADGVHVSDPGCNCASPVSPNVDMIQEFKVQGASFAAENSKGPVVVSSVSRSGGSEFHGEGYYYGRRPEFNTNDWLANRTSLERPNSSYSFPGFNIGGPLLIPGTSFNKDRNKVFFFAGVEFIRQNIDTGTRRAVVPTEAWRKGDFSDQAYMDLLNGGKWAIKSRPTKNGFDANGKLVGPPDPGGLALMKLYPLPNADPSKNDGFNWAELGTVEQPMTQFLTRVDYSISENTKLYTRYNLQRETQPFKYGLWWDSSQVPLPSRIVAPNVSDSISVNLSHVFNPTLTNEFTFGYTFIDFPNQWEDPSKVSKSAIGYPYKGLYKDEKFDQIPAITDWSSGVADLYEVGGFDPILFATKHLASVGDNVMKVMSTHTVKAGFYYEFVINKQPNSDLSNGRIIPATWAGKDTGNSYANLLMGVTSEYYESTLNLINDESYNVMEGYIQDSWKATPKLTVEYGMRLSHLGPWSGRNGAAAAVWDGSRYSNNPADLTKYTGVVDHFIDANVPFSGSQSRALYFGPRFGLAYSVFKNTVIRGGFGTFNFHDAQQAGALTNPPRTLKTNTYNYLISEIDALAPEKQKTGLFLLDLDDDKMPLTHSWNFTISQRLPRQMLLETSYVGNKSNNLLNNGKNINVVPEGTKILPVGQAIDNWDNYRPYQNYGTIQVSRHEDYSNYHSLQMLLARQTGRLTYSAAYTFSKALGLRNGGWATGVGSNVFDRRHRDYGILGFDRTHVFNIAYSWLMPDVFHGNPFGRAMVNGWQFTGITSLMSGVNLGAQTGNFSVANQIGSNSLGSEHITGTPDTTIQPFVTCDPTKNLQQGQYFNPTCFAPPQPGKNGMFQFPYIRGPMYSNHDLSVFKNFPIGNSEERKLQIRFAAYNFLNHPLDSFEGTGDVGLKLTFRDGALTEPTKVGRTQIRYGKRIAQFAIKFMF